MRLALAEPVCEYDGVSVLPELAVPVCEGDGVSVRLVLAVVLVQDI